MAEVGFLNKQHPLYQEDLKNIISILGFQELHGKAVLITGATGLIGVCLIDALMLANKNGAGISVFAVGRNKNMASYRLGEYYNDKLFSFIEQDVRMPLPQNMHLDYIIPLASNTHPAAYSKYPIETIEINVKGAEYALKKALECKATVLYPSTVEIYGNARGEDVFTEDYTGELNLATARSCYTEAKRVCEAMCQSFIAEEGVNVKIVRLSRVFGPTMLMSDTKASSQFITNALRGENIVLKSRGEQFFSYTYVADAVAAMLYVMIYGESGKAYNIANEQCNAHLIDFAAECATLAGKKLVFELPSDIERKGFSIAQNAILNTKRLLNLGYRPIYSLKSAIERTIKILS